MEYSSYDYGQPVGPTLGSEVLQFYLIALFFVIGLAILLVITRLAIKAYYAKHRFHDHCIYLVRLPKEKPGDEQKDFTLQQMQEEISQGEAIFSAIGGLKAQRGFHSWLIGRNDHFSFEIVAHNQLISFYIATPREMSRYVQQQVQAHYPDAVMEEVRDYNIFSPSGVTLGGSLKAKRDFIYPIRTYRKMEVDPLNSLINVMSKLGKDEAIAIQYVVRSAKGSWHSRISSVVQKAISSGSMSEAVGSGGALSALSGFISAKSESADKPQKRLTAMEEEMLKAMEDKNAKAGLDVNTRVVVSGRTKIQARAYLDNLLSAFSQYNYYEYGNSIVPRHFGNSKKYINDFIYRRFDYAQSFLLNTEELASLFHFPLREAETPNILWLTAKDAPAPTNLPEDGILLGHNNYRGVKKEIRIKRADRRRHMYVLGKSGGGKSQFIANMAVQDIMNGEGVCVIDPHGDLIEDILSRVPASRADDVVIFSPADIERPMGLNLIEFNPRYPEQKTFVINEMISIFDKLYDLKATGGPIFEQYMRNALLLIMSDPATGSTLMEVPKVLADADFRRLKLDRCPDPTVVDFWKREAEKAGGDAALANVVPYITSKLTSFISNDMMRPIIGQQKSSFNLREIMDGQKILLVDLPKGIIGEMNAYLLGMIIVGKILMNSLSRADMPASDRKDFYLYIDEFQNFTTNSICQILSEARKYGLSLVMAHQYIGQLSKGGDTSIKDAVFGNVGTMVTFKIGTEDAAFLEKEFSPVFNQYDLVNIDAYKTYAKLLIDNAASKPFSMSTPWPIAGIEDKLVGKKIRSLSRLRYGSDKSIVDAEIKRRCL
jgi:hypothetical protein